MSEFGVGLRQPDQRSCGAAVAVVAEMLRSPRYAARVTDEFDAEVLAMHRRLTGPVDVRQRPQVPWLRALGTPPWALAAQLTGTRGIRHRTRLIRGRSRAALTDLRAGAGLCPVPLYVGSRLLPRHVVLVLDASLETYDPASGRTHRLTERDFLTGTLRGWPVPWFAVLPVLPDQPAASPS